MKTRGLWRGATPVDGGSDAAQIQSGVDAWFGAHAADWREIYSEQSVFAATHERRRSIALNWIDRLNLSHEADALDVGCGAGPVPVSLAQRGFRVIAVDRMSEMLDSVRQEVAEAHVHVRLALTRADAHALPFRSHTFDLVVALGVLPWLHSPMTALEQMARLLRPGGYLIANIDNLTNLAEVVDPRRTPLLAPVRRPLRSALERVGILNPRTGSQDARHRIAEFDEALAKLDFDVVDAVTVGFGPFTLMGREILPPRLGLQLNDWFTRHAEAGTPVLRDLGAAYLVLARRRPLPGSGTTRPSDP